MISIDGDKVLYRVVIKLVYKYYIIYITNKAVYEIEFLNMFKSRVEVVIEYNKYTLNRTAKEELYAYSISYMLDNVISYD